jgi:hypothetical protein
MNEAQELRRWLAGELAKLLVGSPFAPPARWRTSVAVVRMQERRLTSRGDFAGWLRANDLRRSADECVRRQVPSGSILVWLEVDTVDAGSAGFMVFDLASALRTSTRTTCDAQDGRNSPCRT